MTTHFYMCIPYPLPRPSHFAHTVAEATHSTCHIQVKYHGLTTHDSGRQPTLQWWPRGIRNRKSTGNHTRYNCYQFKFNTWAESLQPRGKYAKAPRNGCVGVPVSVTPVVFPLSFIWELRIPWRNNYLIERRLLKFKQVINHAAVLHSRCSFDFL